MILLRHLKLVRKFGEYIFGNPKYDKLLNRKPYSPGQHGQSRRGKLSNYGVQLQEKQKIKFMYGLLEKQFRLNFERAEKMTGETGTNMLQLLAVSYTHLPLPTNREV